MYLAGAANVVQAVDAATGDRLWEYRRDLSAAVESVLRPRSRSIAIYGDKVYLNAADAHIVALDARTGEVAWDHEVADNAPRLSLHERPPSSPTGRVRGPA